MGTGGNFTVVGPAGPSTGWLEQATGYTHSSLEAHPGVVTSATGGEAGCDRIRWYAHESYVWCREGSACTLPQPTDPPNVNKCADGSEPKFVEPYGRVNPCDPQGRDYGVNFTVPAQIFNVNTFRGKDGQEAIVYYGERSKSAPDGLKSHNYQAWQPIAFKPDRTIELFDFPATFEVHV